MISGSLHFKMDPSPYPVQARRLIEYICNVYYCLLLGEMMAMNQHRGTGRSCGIILWLVWKFNPKLFISTIFLLIFLFVQKTYWSRNMFFICLMIEYERTVLHKWLWEAPLKEKHPQRWKNLERRGGVIIYQNPKVPHRPNYYESMGKMRHKIPKH